MKQRHRWVIGVLVAVALAVLALLAPGEEGAIAQGGIIYVDADAGGLNDGSSWTDAFVDLQDALYMAGLGDQIRVAAGTYKPTHEFTEGDPRSASFQMMNGVEIYGGFDPTAGATEWEDRDWVSYVTILSGDIGAEGDSSDNSYHVFYHPDGTNLDDTAILDGFTIVGGNANGNYPHYDGGGMHNGWASSPTLNNCTVEGNSAMYNGGGMYNYWSSSPLLTNCTFIGNSAGSYGGGMFNGEGSSPSLTDSAFKGNTALGGAGMYNESGMFGGGSSPTLTNCVFVDNTAVGYSNYGGGMANDDSSPTLSNCTFEGNSANSGGGMYNTFSAPTLTDCTFAGNSGGGYGGAMANWYSSSPTLINCIFTNNSAGYYGGAISNYSSSPTLTNCTFSGNMSPNGGGIYNYDSTPAVTNSILWGDSPQEIANSDLFLSPLVTYSDVQGGHPGEGNIDADPLFVDAGGGDYHLRSGSPCIDAGSNTAPNLPPFDFESDERILDGDGDGTATVDMGVDEFYREPPPPVIFVDADAEGANTGTSWDDAFTTLQPALDWAVDGVEIWVARGVYEPVWRFSESDPRSATFQMKNGVAIYGGFDPSVGVTEFEQRAWMSYETILSGDIGIEGDNSDNSYHVFFHPEGTNLNSTAILDGFTIRGGSASGNYPNERGGGMYNVGSSPRLTNCAIFDNTASYGGGGGMWNLDSSPTLTYVIFWGNSASGSGGGMLNDYGASPMLTSCVFQGNSANWAGGGMANYGNSPVLTDCRFSGNSAGSNGGGMYNFYYSAPIMTGCTFDGNSAPFGGGLYNGDSSSPTLTGCIFSGNSALDSGGGMWNSNGSSPVLTNCAFSGNSADYGGGMNNNSSSPVLTNCIFHSNLANAGNGGGMYNWDSSSPTLTNCTLSGNSAGSDGGGVFNHFNSSAALTNSILWGNSPNQIANDSSTPVVTYCNVQGGYAGTGNIDADPVFVDPASGDFHLSPTSPCIDTGNNDAPYLPDYDFEGDPRILDGNNDGTFVVDMGVDEVVYSAPPVVEVEIDIRPGSDQNVINLGSGGVVPVAILTTAEFDASTVRPGSVRFAGAQPRRWTMEDVDRDGDLDLLLNFRIQELDLDESSTEATLTGETFPHAGGVPIEGTDMVRIIP